MLELSVGYGVATISKLLKIIGLFCKRYLSKRMYSAKEAYIFKEPTNHSYPILNARVVFRLLHARSIYRSTFLPGLVLRNLHRFLY